MPTVEILSSLDVKILTDEAYLGDSGVAQLPYTIQLTFRNIGSGTQQTNIKAVARGDGGGMSVA